MTHSLRRRARRRLAALFVPLLAALLAAPGALAQTPDPVGSEFQVNSYTDFDQAEPSVAALAGGGFVVTWHSNIQDGSNWGVFGQRYDADGNAVGSEFQINSYTSATQAWSSVVALTGGGFVVTWMSQNQDGSGYGIYGRRYDASGNAVGSEFRVNTTTASHQLYPSVAGLAGGGFVATWQSLGQDGSDWGVYGRRYDASGNPVDSEFQVNTYTNSSQWYPSVAGLAGGGFVVTWQSLGQDGSSWGVYGQRYDASGGAVDSEFQVNTHTNSSQERPSAAALAGGGFVVTWQSLGQDGSDWGVYGQRYDASGNAAGSEFRVNTETNSSQVYPSVAALAGGGFVATWQSYGDGSHWGVYGQRYDASGNPAGSEFLVNTYTANNQLSPSVAGLAGGGFVVTWQSLSQDGSFYGVYGQRYEPVSVPLTFQVDAQYLALGANEVLGLRGDTAPLSWDQSLVLQDDDSDDVWTGTAYFDETLAGARLEYKFVRHTPAQANLPAGDLGILGGFEGNVGPGDHDNRVLEPVPAEATTLPVVTYDNFVPVACDLPRIDEQVFDGAARTITITFADADGLAAVDFTDPDGNDYLNNLVVTEPAGFTSSDGIRWTAPSPAPAEAVFVLSQDDPSIPQASYFAVLTDACTTPAAQVTVIDPVFEMGTVPGEFALGSAYPNPLRAGGGLAAVPYEVPEASAVRVVVYDVLGREVATLVDGRVEAGRHEARLDGADLAPGTYVVRLTAEGFAATRRLTIVR